MNDEDMTVAMAVRDVMSAAQTLSELAASKSEERRVRSELNDIHLAYVRLGRMISHLRRDQSHAA